MRDFGDRIGSGSAHERRVYEALLPLCDTVELIGQSQLSTEMRFYLRRINTRFRWFPDMLAVFRKQLWLVDPKFGRMDTDSWDIEVSAFDAHPAFQDAFGVPVVYVWADLTCSYHDDVKEWVRGPFPGVGQWRTDYYLVPKSVSRPLDEVFTVNLRPMRDIRPPP
jgi:hypothetical protein